MNLLTAFEISFKAIATNKIRSILTALGIIIGVAAVIILLSITQGAKKRIEEQVTSLGGKTLIVQSGKRGVELGRKAIVLTDNDLVAIEKLESTEFVAPLINSGRQVSSVNQSIYSVVLGTSPDFISINDWFTEEGTFFNRLDVLSSVNVCVLGKTVALHLFANQDPLGQSVRIGRNSFIVIGVMQPLGQTSSGKDQDDIIFIPYTTYKKTIESFQNIKTISVSVRSMEDTYLAENEITQLLRQRHNINNDDNDSFYIRNQISVINRIFTITKIMSVLLGSIASISLIVGGIGIMNIMLVSVKERTREIGIRMAVGAKERDILAQFLVEAILLSSVGGIIGILVGITGSKVATYITNWPTVITLGSIILSFGFAAIIGIFFGYYPALQASKMDPIQALRYE